VPSTGKAHHVANTSQATQPAPWHLKGEALSEADVTGHGQDTNAHRGSSLSEPKVWYVRWGQSISGFFRSVSDKLTALWRGVSNAADTVARFFSGKGAESHTDVATMHIKESPPPSQTEPSGAAQKLSQPNIYFPLPESTKNEEIPGERKGILGGIPVTAPSSTPIAAEETEEVAEVKSPLAEIPAGQKKFEAYVAARGQAVDMLEYALDEECVQYAEHIFQPLFILQSTPDYRLSEQEKLIYEAAKELKSANADCKKRINEEEQKRVREAERARLAEEAARKQPGQADFEEFFAAFEQHRTENTRFVIYDGSKYLQDACLEYGRANSNNFSADQQSALRYLTCWREDPQRSMQRMEQARQFVSLEEVERQTSIPTEAMTEHLTLDSSKATGVDETPAPPRPVPRWISMLSNMKQWDAQHISRIAGVLSMQEDQVRKAMDGLRAIAKMASETGAPAPRDVGSTPAIDQILNYDAEANRQASNVLESLELAKLLVDKLKGDGGLVFDESEKAFFESLKNVIGNVSDALDKKLKEVLPVKSSAAAQKKIRIPSLAELKDLGVIEGGKLFETYVNGYTKRSNNVSYALPETSNYLKPECLAFAKGFTEQVEHMPKGVEVDTDRLYASLYLLDQATKRGLVET